MAWINVETESYNSTLPRNRLSLVKSTDGMNWEFLLDIERFTPYGDASLAQIFQIIDTSMFIDDTYIYIPFGRSYSSDGSAHGKQSIRFVRLEKDKLPAARAWDDATIADPTRAATLEIETMPQTIFGVGDLFYVQGGAVKETAFNGSEKIVEMSDMIFVGHEPNMFEKGKQTITLMNLYAQYVTYDIEITDNYDVVWNIQGDGEVSPQIERIAKGLERKISLLPAEGWGVKSVLINGEKATVADDQISVVGTGNLSIDVVFTENHTGLFGTSFPWWSLIPIAGGVVVLAGGGTAVGVYLKKRKQGRK